MGLSFEGLFVFDGGSEPLDELRVQLFYRAIVIPLIVAEIDIEVDPAVFRPGVEGDMAFAEADHGGEAGGVEVMVDLA